MTCTHARARRRSAKPSTRGDDRKARGHRPFRPRNGSRLKRKGNGLSIPWIIPQESQKSQTGLDHSGPGDLAVHPALSAAIRQRLIGGRSRPGARARRRGQPRRVERVDSRHHRLSRRAVGGRAHGRAARMGRLGALNMDLRGALGARLYRATEGQLGPLDSRRSGVSGPAVDRVRRTPHKGEQRVAPPLVAILNFAQAQGVAREMRAGATRIAAGMPIEVGPYTVNQCVAEYLTWMEQNRKSAKDACYRAEALIVPKLGAIECEKLRTGELRGWLQEGANTPARIRRKKGNTPRFRAIDVKDEEAVRRRRALANRTLTILKAALNMAWREGKIASDDPWRRVTPFDQADAARVRYLQIDEARRLINASEPKFRALVRSALATGARFSELANLRVGDFNPDAGTAHVRASKSGKGRHIVLTEEGIRQFEELCAGRAPTEWILVKRDSGKWLKPHQTRPMREACLQAGDHPLACFHTLRHTYASLSIMAGAPLLVVLQTWVTRTHGWSRSTTAILLLAISQRRSERLRRVSISPPRRTSPLC